MAISKRLAFISALVVSTPIGTLAAFAFTTLLGLALTLLSPFILVASAVILLDFLSKKLVPEKISTIKTIGINALKVISIIPLLSFLIPAMLLAACIIIPLIYISLSIELSVRIATKLAHTLSPQSGDIKNIINPIIQPQNDVKDEVTIDDWTFIERTNIEHFDRLFDPKKSTLGNLNPEKIIQKPPTYKK